MAGGCLLRFPGMQHRPADQRTARRRGAVGRHVARGSRGEPFQQTLSVQRSHDGQHMNAHDRPAARDLVGRQGFRPAQRLQHFASQLQDGRGRGRRPGSGSGRRRCRGRGRGRKARTRRRRRRCTGRQVGRRAVRESRLRARDGVQGQVRYSHGRPPGGNLRGSRLHGAIRCQRARPAIPNAGAGAHAPAGVEGGSGCWRGSGAPTPRGASCSAGEDYASDVLQCLSRHCTVDW
jgi:hypothetical protein